MISSFRRVTNEIAVAMGHYAAQNSRLIHASGPTVINQITEEHRVSGGRRDTIGTCVGNVWFSAEKLMG